MMQYQLSEEQVAAFVLAAHNDLQKVQELYSQNPALLTVPYPKFNETALQAAGHMGRRDITEYLLARGAPLTIFAAAMLGRIEDVRTFLQRDVQLASAVGVHRISLFYHAALSGEVELVQLLFDHGAAIDSNALHAACKFGHSEMVKWLIEKGVPDVNVLNFDNRTPLSVATEKGAWEIVDLLKQHGGTV